MSSVHNRVQWATLLQQARFSSSEKKTQVRNNPHKRWAMAAASSVDWARRTAASKKISAEGGNSVSPA
jgi:hypothetical protein